MWQRCGQSQELRGGEIVLQSRSAKGLQFIEPNLIKGEKGDPFHVINGAWQTPVHILLPPIPSPLTARGREERQSERTECRPFVPHDPHHKRAANQFR